MNPHTDDFPSFTVDVYTGPKGPVLYIATVAANGMYYMTEIDGYNEFVNFANCQSPAGTLTTEEFIDFVKKNINSAELKLPNMTDVDDIRMLDEDTGVVTLNVPDKNCTIKITLENNTGEFKLCLHQKTAKLERQVDYLQDQTTKLDSKLDSELKTVNGKIEPLEGKLSDDVSNLEHDVSALEHDVSKLTADLKDLTGVTSTSFERIENVTSRTLTSLNSLAESVSRHLGHFDKLKDIVQQQQFIAGKNQSTLEKRGVQVDKQGTQLAEQQSKLDNLDEEVTKIVCIVGNQAVTINTQQSTIDLHNKSIERANAEIVDIYHIIDKSTNIFGEHVDNVDKLKSIVIDLKELAAMQQTAISNQQGTINRLEALIGKQQALIDKQQETNSKLEARLTELETQSERDRNILFNGKLETTNGKIIVGGGLRPV